MKIEYHCIDLKATTNGSLEALASSFGIVMKNKKIMDEYKSTMSLGFQLEPDLFIEYAMDDVVSLEKIFLTRISTVNDIIDFLLPEHTHSKYNVMNIKNSTG